ncbi:MAG: NADH-quinone oxidoreductase subunit C [bacterium]
MGVQEGNIPEHRFLKSLFGVKVLSETVFRGEKSIRIMPEAIVDAVKALRDDFQPSYNYLSYITADHYIDRTPPIFHVHYGLQALPTSGDRLRLTVPLVDRPDANLPSIIDIHPGADWQECEVFDLFGIVFTGRENLERILTPGTYDEHPLRRDFPHGGPELFAFHDRLIAQWNIAEERDYTGKFGDPWIRKIDEAFVGKISLKRIPDEAGLSSETRSPGDIGEKNYPSEKPDSERIENK